MKKNFIIAGILSLIALVCAFAIAGINELTANTILKSQKEKETTTCQAIFEAYDESKSTSLENADLNGKDSRITKIITAKDSNGTVLGTIYTVSGSNDYGIITLMVAIKDESVIQVEFLENSQSFASTVNSHVKKNYPSSKDNVIYPLIKPEEAPSVGALDQGGIDGVDVNCGATYGAKLVKELVNVALKDVKEAK